MPASYYWARQVKTLHPTKSVEMLSKSLLKACDEHLREVVIELGITRVIGIGKVRREESAAGS